MQHGLCTWRLGGEHNSTGELLMPQFTWSFSNLELFEMCPKKYYHLRIKKDVQDKGNPMSDYGFEAHKHFEGRLVKGKKLPMDLLHHEKFLAKLVAAKGEGLGEQKLALTRDFQPTGFFDTDVWVRGIVDYTKHNAPHIVIVDHKFGKVKEGFTQLKLMVAMLFAYLPEMETATGMYYWAKEKRITSIKFTRADLPDIWSEFLPRVEQMELAVKTTDFPAQQNFLCKKYCPVKSCPHHGQ